MKLHIRNITDALEEWIEDESICVGDAVYEGFSPLTDDRCLSSLIYILDPQKPGSFSCVPETCIFFSKESYASASSLNRILLNDNIAFSEVIARIEALFRYFNTWAEALHESLIQENGVRALLDLSIPVFQNPILLMQIDYKEHIVILLNISRSGLPPEQGLTRLGNYLSDHNLSAGLSTLFTDFYQVQSYLHQAEAALEMGLAQKDREPLYRFKNFALAYLLSNARGNLQIEQLLPDGLKRLIEHDQQFHTTYVTVLRTYLENKCNIGPVDKVQL